jgi:predicted aspartyl protease
MILLPLIHVELVSDTVTFTTIALIDSGATLTFMPYEIADILEVNPHEVRQTVPVETAGGLSDFVPVSLKRLSLLAGEKIFSDYYNITVLVPPNPSRDLPYVLLGRDSIFNRFHITFEEKIKKFVVQHHKWARKYKS